MNVTRYYPFERNRYFYGKLLTVRDFESEQKYFNNKRRMINRLLHGTGIVSGLHVVAVDDKSVTIEMGFALDQHGREIIIPSPVTQKLSTIEGFSNNEYAKNVYLCVAYEEKGKEPVHSVASSSSRTEEVSEYNRFLESYKLFIQETPPEPSSFELSSLIKSTSTIYQDEEVRILQTTPRYIYADEEFEVVLKVEKTMQSPTLQLKLELDEELFELVGEKQEKNIQFLEPQGQKQTEYTIVFQLRAKAGISEEQSLFLRYTPSSTITKGDQQFSLSSGAMNVLSITDTSIRNRVLKDYFSRTLDQSLHSQGESCVYLAKIDLLQMGSTYMIEKVTEAPFQEYVHNPSFLNQLDSFLSNGKDKPQASKKATESGAYPVLEQGFSVTTKVEQVREGKAPYLEAKYVQSQQELQLHVGFPHHVQLQDEVRTGVVEMKVGQRGGFLKAKGIYSEEIEHGLGTHTPLLIVTAIEEISRNVVGQEQRVFFGDTDVFKDSEYESEGSNLAIGTMLYVEKGTFRLGIKQKGSVTASKIKIRWWAIKKTAETAVQVHQKPLLESEIAASHQEE
ncbi:hypothetical protein [Bacillus horti]|uniref:Uncharacterized protein n=1 Tax=Caldalkalibacillus horti TaxID=77523 RepID=A0ABT9VZZ0_9BACI|nr:hypothetical protein [Bacillus horti]MDQ0166570.1 hypothetical protein [Bacillus horti]